MRFLLASLLAMQCVSISYSMSYDVSDEDEEQALRGLWSEQNQLPVCGNSPEAPQVDRTNVKNLFGITNGIYALVDSFGSVLNRVSGRGKCRKSYGSVNGVSWVYYTTGRNCETAPEVSNIKGAVKNHLETNDGKTICGMECLDLTQPRDWNGFLLIGPTSNFDTTCTAGRLCLSTLILLA